MIDPAYLLVDSAQPANVDTVIVDGRILKRRGQLTAVDVKQVIREANQSLKRLSVKLATGRET
jgi:cytosine/adenosine deaminase-related metal-dependent hydrolase